jgi:hypothetical protein
MKITSTDTSMTVSLAKGQIAVLEYRTQKVHVLTPPPHVSTHDTEQVEEFLTERFGYLGSIEYMAT